MSDIVHLTLEINVPVEKLESVMSSVYSFSKDEDILTEIFIIRGNVSAEEIGAIFSRAAGSAQRIVTLLTKEEVMTLKNAARGTLDSAGDA